MPQQRPESRAWPTRLVWQPPRQSPQKLSALVGMLAQLRVLQGLGCGCAGLGMEVPAARALQV